MNNLNVLEMNNFNFVSYKSDDTPTITNNKLVDVEQRIINDYKNSSYNMADYANAFRDLLKNEFSDELGEAFEWLKSDRVSLDSFDYIDTFSD